MRIFEYCERPLHGKVAVVDGEWATVGSSNLDPLSLGLNLEANVLIRDRDFALGLQARLRELVVHRCREVELAMPSPSTLWWSRWNHALLYRLLHWWPRWLHALPAQQAVIQPLRDLP